MIRPTHQLCAVFFGAILPALIPACASRSLESSGSSTHFLRECDDNSTCGGGLSCICGRCTNACDEDAECTGLDSDAVCGDPTALSESCSGGDLPNQACILRGMGDDDSGDSGDTSDTSVDGATDQSEQACVQTDRGFAFHIYDGEELADEEVGCSPTRQGPYVFGRVTGSETTAQGTSYAFELCEQGAETCQDTLELRIEVAFHDADEGSDYVPSLVPTIPENFAYQADCACTQDCRSSVYTVDPISGPRLTWTVNGWVPRVVLTSYSLSCSDDAQAPGEFVQFSVRGWADEEEQTFTQGDVASIDADKGTLEIEFLDSSTSGSADEAGAEGTQYVAHWIPGAPVVDEEFNQNFDEAATRWAEFGSGDYSMKVHNTCFGCLGTPEMDVEVTVVDGKIQSALGRDAEGNHSVEIASIAYEQWYTVAGLFQIAAREHQEADLVSVTYDDEYGVPVGLGVDPITEHSDDQYDLTVSSFELLEQ